MRHIVTKEHVQQQLEANSKVTRLVLLILFIVLSIVSLGILALILFLPGDGNGSRGVGIVVSAICALLAARFGFAYVRQRNNHRNKTYLQFAIITDTVTYCAEENDEGPGTPGYRFQLQTSGWCYQSGKSFLVPEGTPRYPYVAEMFSRIKEGDTVYLVVLLNDFSIDIIIPAAEWELSSTDFIEDDGVWFPAQ